MNELNEIRQPYIKTISMFASDSTSHFIENNISPNTFYQAVVNYMCYRSGADPFPAKKFEYIAQLQPYFNDLVKLADKWRLRAPWALVVLLLFDIFDSLSAIDVPDKAIIPLEKIESLYPWTQPMKPLKIMIPAWAFFLAGRDEILADISVKLKCYEKKLKKKYPKEHPSSLSNHARWWFLHHVENKTYSQITDILKRNDEETIKKGVLDFSKLVGIDIKN
jgi:hypothetical protein